MLKDTFLNVKSQQLCRKYWDNSNYKCDQRKAILDVIEFRVSKIIYKRYSHNRSWIWGWSFVCPSVSLIILRSTIVTNAFSSNLKTHKSQIFPIISPRGVAKLSTSPKVTIFPPPVFYYFIWDQCLKDDCWITLFLRKSVVAMDFQSLQTHKTRNILRRET